MRNEEPDPGWYADLPDKADQDPWDDLDVCPRCRFVLRPGEWHDPEERCSPLDGPLRYTFAQVPCDLCSTEYPNILCQLCAGAGTYLHMVTTEEDVPGG
jgi:hypothetical protein